MRWDIMREYKRESNRRERDKEQEREKESYNPKVISHNQRVIHRAPKRDS